MAARFAVAICLCFTLCLAATPAHAWIENRVLAAEARLVVERSGKATVEQRMTLWTNGNERLHEYRISGIDRDAVANGNSYAVPAGDALSSSLDSAVPVALEVDHGKATADEPDPAAQLVVRIGDPKGLRRGRYVFVLRYQTDLRVRGLIERDGALVRINWHGPSWTDGFDNTRTTFVLPAAPTAPRAVEDPTGEAAEDERIVAPTYLSEVRRGEQQDEIELLRTYASAAESIAWAVRVDQRALDPLPKEAVAASPDEAPPVWAVQDSPAARPWLIGAAAGLWLLFTLLVALRAREVARHAKEARAVVPPLVPLPVSLRAALAGVALVAGVAAQLLWAQPVAGALLVLLAAALGAHGVPRLEPKATLRGPGRWLSVTEREALSEPPRPRGAYLDASTRAGKLLLLLLLAGVGVGVWFAARRSVHLAMLIGADAVALLALFGTGRLATLPPDMAVEPARLLRRVARRLAKMRGASELRLVPRIRVPEGAMDPDELRLLVAPRLPLRGFAGIEIGVTYALGAGARVAMPEVLLRVMADSPCEQAVVGITRSGRVTPGRKPNERVIAISPRLPTVRMTAEIVAALAARVVDRDAVHARGSAVLEKIEKLEQHDKRAA